MGSSADKNLYDVLGVQRGVSEDELRKSYRRLARKHHPDVNPNDKVAEERFKEISAAYDVLSNPEKRKLYDEFGTQGLREGFDPNKARAYQSWSQGRQATGSHGGHGGEEESYEFDLGDLFGDLFTGRQKTKRGRSVVPGADLLATVEIDLAQAVSGAEIQLNVPSMVECATCHGSGDEPGTHPVTCPECKGTGKKPAVKGPMRITRTCETCGGSGELKTPCHTCHGSGSVEGQDRITVRIPPGADNGSRLRVPGRGAPGEMGGPPGDLVIETRVRPHPFFKREGRDLRLKLPLTLSEAYDGAQVDVPTPTGTVKLKVPPRSQSGQELRLRGKGIKRGKQTGDLYVTLEVRLPEQDDPKLRDAFTQANDKYTRPVREGLAL